MNCVDNLLKNVIAADCKKVAIAGIKGRVVIIPYDYIDRSTIEYLVDFIDPQNPGKEVLDGFRLKAGKYGIAFDSLDNSAIGSVGTNRGTYRNTFIHNLTIRAFSKNTTIKDTINKMIGGRFIVVVKNFEEGRIAGEISGDWTSTYIEVYGINSGVKLAAINGDTAFADGVTYELVFGSDDISQEMKLPAGVAMDSGTLDIDVWFDSLYPKM